MTQGIPWLKGREWLVQDQGALAFFLPDFFTLGSNICLPPWNKSWRLPGGTGQLTAILSPWFQHLLSPGGLAFNAPAKYGPKFFPYVCNFDRAGNSQAGEFLKTHYMLREYKRELKQNKLLGLCCKVCLSSHACWSWCHGRCRKATQLQSRNTLIVSQMTWPRSRPSSPNRGD